MKYQDKDVIVQEGTQGNTFYIILKGEVKQCHACEFNVMSVYCVFAIIFFFYLSCVFTLQVLVTKNVNGQQKQIRRMVKGEHFGEQALIR